jgi:hypothetical protein
MKKTALFSAMMFGASTFALPVLAQDAAPAIPGSETVIEENNAAERDAVAAEPGAATDAPVASPDQQTIVPGSESERELNEAEERDGVAEGTGAATTGATTADGTAPIVPGSGATFSPSEAPESQAGEALQDESPTEEAQ